MKKLINNFKNQASQIQPDLRQKLLRFSKQNLTQKRIPALTATGIFLLVLLWLFAGSDDTIVIAGNNQGTNPEAVQINNADSLPPQSVKSFVSRATLFQPKLKLTGQTAASRILNIKSEIASRIEFIAVDIGDVVEKGDLLLKFATEDKQAQLQEAEANLRRATKEYEVIKELGEQGFKAELAVLQAESALAAAQARLAEMRNDFDNIEITAPYKAVITEKHAEVGDYLQQGSQALSLMEADPLLLQVQMSEKNFYDVAVGQQVKVRLANNAETIATIKTISPAADEQTRTFAIEAAIANTDYRHPIGATASVEVQLQPILAHRVKSSHLSLNDEGLLGIKILDGNRARFRPVNIIGDEAGIIWVTGYLSDELNQQVTIIAQGQGFVSDGQKVISQSTAAAEIFNEDS